MTMLETADQRLAFALRRAAKAEAERDALKAALEKIAKEADEPRKFWSKRIGDMARAALANTGERR